MLPGVYTSASRETEHVRRLTNLRYFVAGNVQQAPAPRGPSAAARTVPDVQTAAELPLAGTGQGGGNGTIRGLFSILVGQQSESILVSRKR